MASKNAVVGYRTAASLGVVDWGGIFSNVTQAAVNYKVADLNARRDAAAAELRIAEQKAIVDANNAKANAIMMADKNSVFAKIPVLPIAIAGVGALGFYFLMKRKGRK